MIIMSKTYTPELTPEVLDRLEDYADIFRDDFSHKKQAPGAASISRGCSTTANARASSPSRRVSPSRRTSTPRTPSRPSSSSSTRAPGTTSGSPERYRRHLAGTFASPEGIFVFDDTSFPKQGKHSVGVQRQYCGALGKKANCQVAPSIHYVSPRGHYPLAMRLFLPECWIEDEDRLDEADVPKDYRQFKTKGQIALELLDTVRGEGLSGWLALADAGNGVSDDFRKGLAACGLKYIVGVTDEMVVFTKESDWELPGPAERPDGTGGRPAQAAPVG